MAATKKAMEVRSAAMDRVVAKTAAPKIAVDRAMALLVTTLEEVAQVTEIMEEDRAMLDIPRARRIRSLSRRSFVLAIMLTGPLLVSGYGRAASPAFDGRQIPIQIWLRIQQAEGIVMGGKKGDSPNIQVIFDANCPWCARLFVKMQNEHPDVAIRWVPIAYFESNSAAIAASILASRDPVKSLSVNFDNYDFKKERGGYPVPLATLDVHLPKPNLELKNEWTELGGYTPMIIYLDKKERVIITGGGADWIVNGVFRNLKPPLRSYRF